jgi:hypothetical protein
MSKHERHLCEGCLQDEYEAYAHDRVHESIDQNKTWLENYKIRSWPRWDYSLEDATLTFSENGKAKVICDIQAVGSVVGDEWEWSWGNGNLPEACKSRMPAVKEFGEEKQWNRLTSLFLPSNEYLGWELASITVHLLGGIGVYRCPDSGTPGYFMYLAVLSSRFVN